jgi:predicted Holliday junction resolvase-like endonuclease
MECCWVLIVCLTIIVIVLICVIGKCCLQCGRLKHEEKMESMKWEQKKSWEDKRAAILADKAWFEEKLNEIKEEQEKLKKKIELL